MTRIAIIGGGISGLAAAHRLAELVARAGVADRFEIRLYEKRHRTGGVLETAYADGYLIEKSADNFATLIPHARDLCRRTGYGDQLIKPVSSDRRAFVWLEGKLHPIPAGFSLMQPTRIGSILATGALSWPGKLRLLAEPWIPARRDQQDESLASFAIRRLGKEAYERLVEPIVSGIFTADATTLSMQATMPQFVAMERQHGSLFRAFLASKREDARAAARRASGARYDQFLAPKRGMSDLVEHLTRTLPSSVSVHTGAAVETLERLPADRWNVHAGAESFPCAGVILATPAYISSRLLADVHPEVYQLLEGIPYASSCVVAVVVRREEIRGRIDGFGMIVPRVAGRPTLAISYTSNKYPGRVPEDEILLRVFFGGALHPGILDEDDRRLTDLALRELAVLLDWRGEAPRRADVIRWPRAMPQYLIGHGQRMEQLKAKLQEFPTLALCGAAYDGVGIPQCVRSAYAAADQLARHLQVPVPPPVHEAAA
ncbi:MAG: protoporphyrinogen oxidase [Pirellulaceae bacterium]|nr:MAG: protoporphyrinogen oxidase [Pirellulaceae bacterium]